MSESALDKAKRKYDTGEYAECLEEVHRFSPQTKLESQERDCLICECTQFRGDFQEALLLAEAALQTELTASHLARYWGVIGRIKLDQNHFQEAAEAFRKGIRAAERSSDLPTLSYLQQLFLITEGQNLGSGLSSAVREAYRTAIRTTQPACVAGFHLRLVRLEAQRGAFDQALHHLSLAESLLGRTENTALLALFHVNKASLLGTVGALVEARRSAELGASLAERAGHLRLAMAAAANVSHIAVTSGDLSVAESWLRKARKAAAKLEVTEVALLESFASHALVRGDFETAAGYLAETRRAIESRDLNRATVTEMYSLLTELYLHKKVENQREHAKVLKLVREAANTLNAWHGNFSVTLAEAESLFDRGDIAKASQKTASCIESERLPLVYLAELNRMAARTMWSSGQHSAARRRLARAASASHNRGSRISWTETLRELQCAGLNEPFYCAYSLQGQMAHATAKFAALMRFEGATWFQTTGKVAEIPRDSMDGFDDAVAILESIEDPELLARETLASVIALKICDGAALINKSDAGHKVVALYKWEKADIDQALKDRRTTARIELPNRSGRPYELILQPKQDLRSLFALTGIRRLLDAARALESQQKDQQRLGALWQPEIIVEEPGAVFSSPQMIELMQTARKVAVTSLPVLLMGDTGTGKEVLARAIHRASPRANKIFLPFNCSAVPRDMVESQLFGYRRGSFTGAHVDFPGIIRSAEGGTLFLDEIGELSMDLQPKLLRFLETNEVHPLGEGKPIKVDVRVIAATNADLDALIERKEFREDLYYRLNIVRFHMPQLSERREEIPPLVMHLLRRFEMDEKKHSLKISDELMEYLLLYRWPGNVRQLSNELRKMVAMAGSNETLSSEYLSPAIRRTRRTVAVDPDAEPAPPPAPEPEEPGTLAVKLDQPLPEAVEALERAMIERAIARTEGRIEEAARLLGISRKGLFLKRRRWQEDSSGGDTPPAA